MKKYYKKRRSMIKFKLSRDILKFQTIKEAQNNLLNIYSYNSNIYLNKKQEWEHVGYFQAKFNLFFIKLWGINLIDYENSSNIIKLNNFIPLLSIHTPNKRDIKWGRETKNTMDILKEHNLQNFNSTNNKFRVAILKGFKILLSDGDSLMVILIIDWIQFINIFKNQKKIILLILKQFMIIIFY